MNKIIVEVRVPAIDKIYDVKLPRDIQIWEATRLINHLIASMNPGLFALDEESFLCSVDTGNAYDVNKLVDDAGLVNGSRVMIV